MISRSVVLSQRALWGSSLKRAVYLVLEMLICCLHCNGIITHKQSMFERFHCSICFTELLSSPNCVRTRGRSMVRDLWSCRSGASLSFSVGCWVNLLLSEQ